MTHKIWVHPDNIRANTRNKGNRPVVVVDHGTPDERHCHGLDIVDPETEKVVAKIVYDNTLEHHRVWVETDLNLVLKGPSASMAK